MKSLSLIFFIGIFFLLVFNCFIDFVGYYYSYSFNGVYNVFERFVKCGS